MNRALQLEFLQLDHQTNRPCPPQLLGQLAERACSLIHMSAHEADQYSGLNGRTLHSIRQLILQGCPFLPHPPAGILNNTFAPLLTHLCLSNLTIAPSTRVFGPALNKLNLICVRWAHKTDLGDFLLESPNLQHLSLDSCSPITTPANKPNLPALQHLYLCCISSATLTSQFRIIQTIPPHVVLCTRPRNLPNLPPYTVPWTSLTIKATYLKFETDYSHKTLTIQSYQRSYSDSAHCPMTQLAILTTQPIWLSASQNSLNRVTIDWGMKSTADVDLPTVNRLVASFLLVFPQVKEFGIQGDTVDHSLAALISSIFSCSVRLYDPDGDSLIPPPLFCQPPRSNHVKTVLASFSEWERRCPWTTWPLYSSRASDVQTDLLSTYELRESYHRGTCNCQH